MSGKVRFEVQAGLYNDFIGRLVEKKIPVARIRRTKFGFEGVCDASDYREIALLGRKFQCRVKIIKKTGIYFRLQKLMKRKGVFAAVIFFFVFSFISSRTVWRININTDDPIMKNHIANRLYNEKINCGTIYSKEKFETVRQNVIGNVDDLAYMTLNFYKGVLDCEVYPSTNREKYTENTFEGDIYSTLDGVITDLRVYSGFGVVQIGQSVSQGDVLVSCTYTDKFENMFYSMTRAYAEGEAEKEYSVFVPCEKTVEVFTGDIEKQVTLCLGSFEKVIKKAHLSERSDYTHRSVLNNTDILGFRLPVTVKTDYYYKRENRKFSGDIILTYNLALTEISHIIENDEKLKKEKGRNYDYKVYDDGVEMICKVQGIYELT